MIIPSENKGISLTVILFESLVVWKSDGHGQSVQFFKFDSSGSVRYPVKESTIHQHFLWHGKQQNKRWHFMRSDDCGTSHTRQMSPHFVTVSLQGCLRPVGKRMDPGWAGLVQTPPHRYLALRVRASHLVFLIIDLLSVPCKMLTTPSVNDSCLYVS